MRTALQRLASFWLAATAPFCVSPMVAGAADTVESQSFAAQLAREDDHAGAALEFRRLAAAAVDPAARGGYDWATAHEYWKAGQLALTDKMLDRTAQDVPELVDETILLRGEAAAADHRWDEADFFFDSLARSQTPADMRRYAARRSAVAKLNLGNPPGARDALGLAPVPEDQALAALSGYEHGRDKRPLVGGLLGAVPGLGYAYAGEYANAVRSLLLNGLFIFGMVATADDEQWGGFAVISFFELTWYSGSIYGGIDASHRYNRERLDECATEVMGAARFAPDYTKLPLISLNFRF